MAEYFAGHTVYSHIFCVCVCGGVLLSMLPIFKLELFGILLFVCRYSLYITESGPLSDICIITIFSQMLS